MSAWPRTRWVFASPMSIPGGRYRIVKEVIADPHQPCVLMHTRLEAEADMLAKLRLFALLAPHLEVGGRGNYGNVVQTNWGKVLTAHKGGTWLVLAASVPFLRCSCGYAGTTDGWQDLARNFRMDWEFDCAPDGNIALTGELDIRQSQEFVLALAFGESLHHALVTACPGAGHFLRRSPRPLHRAVAACLPSHAAGEGEGDRRRRPPLSRQPQHDPGA